MKKVLSFCVFSVLLAMFSLSTKAQGGVCCVTMTPSSFPTTIVLDSVYTFDLHPFLGCIDESTKISLEWELYRNGVIIPQDSLTSYLNEFRFQTKIVNGENVTWVGDDYTSNYCDDGDGRGSYPGAYTPVNGVGDCARNGYFSILGAGGQNNPDFFDFFYAKFFQDPVNTAHRLRVNFKEDGDYSIVINIHERIGGTAWDHFVGNDERYKIGGHQSILGDLIQSDSLTSIDYDTIAPVTICVGSSFTIGDSTYYSSGVYDATFTSPSECSGVIYRIVHFELIVDNPKIPILDLNNSQTQICEDGNVTLTAIPVDGGTCIWYDYLYNPIDTALSIHPMITNNTNFYVVSYNDLSDCISPDTLQVYVEHYNSPIPNLLTNPTNGIICAEQNMNIYLDHRYTTQNWLLNGNAFAATDTVHYITNAVTTDGGRYRVNVSEIHTHAVYTTNTLSCYGADSVDVVVNELPVVTLNPDTLITCVGTPVQFNATSPTATHYTWNPGTFLSDQYIATPTFGAVVPNPYISSTYTYSIRVQDENGCSSHRDTMTVIVNALPVVTVTAQYPEVCLLRNTDTLIFGGAVEYIWTDGVTTDIVTENVEVLPTVTTTYNVTGTDANGCTNTANTTIIVYPEETIAFDFNTLDTTYCQNTTPVVLPTTDMNGIPGTWSPEAISTTTVGTADYTFTPDPARCADPVTITVRTYELPVIMISQFNADIFTPQLDIFISDFVCPNAGPQVVYNNISYGLAPYTTTWFGVDAFDNNLGTGTVNIATTCNTPYAVKVITTDANGCVAKDTARLSFTVNDVDAPVLRQLLNTVEAAPSLGGVCGYIVPDVRTADYFTATDNCNIVDTVQTPAAGTIIYEEQVVTVTISDMCGHTDHITVNVTIPAHVAVRDSLLSMELCPGNNTGSIRVWASQGIAPYEVVLKDRDRDTIVNTVASTNDSCDFTGLSAMNYKVVVTDRNGCKDSTEMYVGTPDALRYTGVDTTMVACFGETNGEIIFDVAGGTQPYYLDIKKDGAAFDLDTTGTNLISYRHTMSNLSAGVYDITITDDFGCTLNSLITITEPTLLEITNISVLNNVQCNGTATGNAQVVVTGGNDAPNYNYYWIAAGTTDTVSRTATTGRILPVGNYNVYVYDVKGCTVNSAVTITEPTLMVLDGDTIVKPTALCTRTGSFEVSVLVTGGTTPYTYTWGDDAAGLPNNDTVQISEILPINCNRTYTASVEIRDDSNCLINRTTQFVVSDVVNPVITGTIDTTEIFNTVCTFADAGDTARTVADLLALPNHGLTISDNCTAQEALIVEHSETTTGTCQKIITRTYTIKDLCDNFATVEHVIVITDNEAPTFTKPADITLFKDNNCNANVTIAATGDVTDEHDNCTATLEATYSDRVVNGCAGVDTIYRTWSLEDACHNQAPSQVQIIAVKDTTRPYFTTIPKDTIIDCDGIGNVADLNAWLANVSAEDRCDVNVLITNNYSVDNHVAGCGNTFSVSVTWYAEDNCGNIATTSATFTVQDTVIPFFTIIPDNAIVNCDIANFDDLFLTWRSNVAYNDNCDTIVNLTWDSRFTQACGNTGNYVVRFYAEDRCGNRAVDSSNFTIIDVTAPVFDVIPVDNVVQCDGAGNILQLKEWLRGPHATDLCDPDLVLTHNCDTIGMHPDGIHFAGYRPERCGGYYDVIWTATDACGNRSTTRERFTIRDTEGPTFDVAPQNKTVQCGSGINIADTIAEWLLSPRISDVCAPVPTLTNDYAPANFVTLCGNTGYVTVTWTAKDTCDNPTIASARFTVIDTVRPVITGTLIQDTVYQTANCREFLPAPVNTVGGLLALGGITDVDGCNITNNSPVVRLGNDELIAGSTDCVHYYRRTYQVRDNCYNTSHLSTNVEHIIVVLDTIHPKVVGTLPELTVYLNDDAVNCDYTLPTPATTLAQLPELTITDCHRDSIAAVSEVEYGNGIGCDRYVTRTYTIADQCGNDTLVYQNIRIVDNTAPRIAGTLINDTVQLTADCVATIPDAFATVADVEAHAGDMTITDCNITDGTSVTLVGTENSTNQCPKIVTRYYEVSDGCGNYSEFTHVIVVEDNVTPTITGELTDLTIYMDAECNYTLPTAAESVTELIAVGGITAITDCNLDPVVTVNDVQDNDNTCDRFYTRTYTVKDSCGNETTAVQTIHVLDNINPAITGELSDLTIYMDAECNYTLPTAAVSVTELIAVGGITAITDCNLNPVVTVNDVQDNNNTCDRFYTRTYTVKDSCGNETTTVQTIHVLDNINPSITGELSDLTIYMDAECNYTLPTAAVSVTELIAVGGITAITDCNLDPVVTSNDVQDNNNTCDRFYTRTYTVKDSCGNETTAVQTIHILDNINPAITGELTDLTIYMDAECNYTLPTAAESVTELIAVGGITAITDCNLDQVVTYNDVQDNDNSCDRFYTRTYTVKDSCGNETTTVQTIHVLDNINPSITGELSDLTIYMDAECNYTLPTAAVSVTELIAVGGITAITDCNLNPVVTVNDVQDNNNTCDRFYTRTYTVKDSCGNETTTVQTIHVLDNINPSITGELSDLTIYMDAECNYTLPTAAVSVTELIAVGGITAITDCNLNPVVTVNDVQDNNNTCDRFYTRTYTVKDSCGNETTTVQTIHILDNIHPAITGELTDLTIYMDAECNYTLPTAAESVTELIAVGGITAITDCNLDPVVTYNDVQDNNNSCDRFYTRTYTVKDSCGNETTAVQTIHVLDNINPAITGELTDLTIYMDAECNYTLPTAAVSVTELIAVGGITAITDCNLNPVVTVNDVQDNNNSCDRFYTRTYTVKDSCGNETTTVQTIHVLDNIAPIITGTLSSHTLYVDGNCNFIYPDTAETINDLIAEGLTSVEDCNLSNNVVIVSDVLNEPNLCDRYVIRTYTVSDSCGNSVNISQRFNVLDTIKPWFTAVIPNQPANSVGGCVFNVPDLTNIVRANSADNCTTDLIVAQDIPAGTVITDTTDVTVTIEDSCHNSSTFTLSITVPQTLTATISTVNVTCYGMANGVATIHPVGGTTPYTYSCALNTPYTIVATGVSVNTLPIGDYTYSVIDDDGCSVDVVFAITQPALLVATLSISNASSCETDDVTTTATVVGGTAPYNYSWERLDEYNVSTPLSSTTDNIVTAEEDGSYTYIVTVVDDTNCVATDTISSQVNPIYFFEDTARVCSGLDYNWVGHRIIAAAELPDSETEYDIYDNLTTTGFGCDSIWVLHLTVTDFAYFELREDGEPNALREIAIHDTVSTGSADKIYELFVRKNCTDCDTKVSIEYEIYRYDSGIGDYVLIPSNVTDYFTPNYVTYLDQSNISYISPSTSQVSIPNLYPNAGLGVARHFDYYNLCFLSPEYACNPVITPSPLPFYSYGRANLINVTQWRTAGDYKILAKLQERTGGSGWGTQGYCPSDGTMGGHQATLTPLVFDIAEIFIHVNQGAGPVIPMRPISFDYITPPTVQTIVPEVNIYPNPAQDYFTIELTGFEGETQVALSNVDGGVVEQLNVNVTEDTRIIRVSSGNYAAGVYVVSARNNDVTLTRRVVIVR